MLLTDALVLTTLDGRDATLRSLAVDGGVVHASLPGLAPGDAEAGDPIAGQLASDGAAVDVTGYYLQGLWPARPVLADWRTWPWPAGLDPFFLMAHSTPEGHMCLMVDGVVQPVTDRALGSWLGARPELSTTMRQLQDPVVFLTCGQGARQRLADLLGRLVWVAHGDVTVGVEPLDAVGRATGGKVQLGVHGTADGLGGQFRSAYPQGPAGDRVRWAYRSRFISRPAHWLVERSAFATRAPAGLRPYTIGGRNALGLCYFDQRDRASRASALNAPVLQSTHVEWTPNDTYQPAPTDPTDLAADLRSRTVPELAGSTAAQPSDRQALAARLDAERRAAVDASIISEKLESYARLLSELEHAKTQLGLTTTLAPPATRTIPGPGESPAANR
ncbi:hypothetical protein ACFRAO_32425 [Streptomyces sp. NPDC056656]|uniref:hypothetical protein n=1 Tax=Streptomyces sp. NPDC056656 TaxID=3345895 RepID=UPI00367ADFD7